VRRVFFTIALLLLALRVQAALPLTVKDISLMLRSGYSSSSVMQELSQRHFADTFDSAKEEMLIKAGASAGLISALKDGTYLLSPEQTSAAQQKIADQIKKRAVDAERSAKSDSRYRAEVLRERTAGPAARPMANVIQEALKNDLVRVHNDSVTHIDDDAFGNKKLIALYFSAHWCGPCRKFTPQLVDYYNRVAPQHPEFEIVFVSSDKSAEAMQNYMREAKMPWPAIDFQKIEGKTAIKKYAGPGIPCLVLVDPAGRVVSDSYEGEKYVGPGKVMSDLDAILAADATKKVAARP
jgi:nucleoredoxin